MLFQFKILDYSATQLFANSYNVITCYKPIQYQRTSFTKHVLDGRFVPPVGPCGSSKPTKVAE